MASFGTCYHEYEKVIKDFATKWKIDKNKMHCISQPSCSELLDWFIVATDFFTTGPGFSNLFFRRAKFVGLNLLNRPLFSIKTPSKFQIFFCISKVRTKKISSAPRKTLRNSKIQKKTLKFWNWWRGVIILNQIFPIVVCAINSRIGDLWLPLLNRKLP